MKDIIFWYHTGFQICVICSGYFLFCSVWLFFRFDIMKIMTDRTGRAVEKSIRRMEKNSVPEQRESLSSHTDMLKVNAADMDLTGKSIENKKIEALTACLSVRFQVMKRVILIHTGEQIED